MLDNEVENLKDAQEALKEYIDTGNIVKLLKSYEILTNVRKVVGTHIKIVKNT